MVTDSRSESLTSSEDEMETKDFRFRVFPLYAQVMILDSKATDFPEWNCDASYVASEQAIYVATRPDYLGDVVVNVDEGSVNLAADEWALVYDGSISCDSGVLQIGNIPAADLADIHLASAGKTAVKVYVKPLDLPEEVRIVLPVGAIQEFLHPA